MSDRVERTPICSSRWSSAARWWVSYDAVVVLGVDPPVVDPLAALGAVMRVAVIEVPFCCPLTRTVDPTGKLVAELGAFLVPKVVWGVTVTVMETPLAVFTVHAPPLTAVTVPRTPGCLALALDPWVPLEAGALAGGGDALAGAEDPDEVAA